MRKYYETELPEGYLAAKITDVNNKKFAVGMTLAAAAITGLVIAAGAAVIRPTAFFESFSFARHFIALVVLILYVMLHELVHGAVYKLLTGRKLTFGITLTAAFCGVPDVFVYRRTALLSLLAPFVVFTLAFGGAALLLPAAWDKMYAVILLAVHLGGCAGDLYDGLLFFVKYRDPDTLMNDTGPKQTIYVKCNKS